MFGHFRLDLKWPDTRVWFSPCLLMSLHRPSRAPALSVHTPSSDPSSVPWVSEFAPAASGVTFSVELRAVETREPQHGFSKVCGRSMSVYLQDMHPEVCWRFLNTHS